MNYYIGVDVGTGSARAGIFDQSGNLVTHAVHEIDIWKSDNYVEQSSNNIWSAVCKCTNEVIDKSKIELKSIKGIGFDATCSLVLIDDNGNPVSVNFEGDSERNIIVWMDHRALDETEYLNSFSKEFSIYGFVGGKLSPEMQMPKLLWIKKNLPNSWDQTKHFFDLPDYLTYKATGSYVRSLCSLSCKWTYLKDKGWDQDYLEKIGLGDLVDNSFSKLGSDVYPMGHSIGDGLNSIAAKEMGLMEGTPVGVSIIDAHAGGIGMIGLSIDGQPVDFNKRLALIGGTSSCHMAVSQDCRFISGVWGPYDSAMVPGLWLNEGGQSATGSLIDHIVFNHNAFKEAQQNANELDLSIYDYLNKLLEEDITKNELYDYLTKRVHVCPYFHGNRSPRANPNLVGMISGLTLSSNVRDLAILYLSTIQAIAYGTRHIIEAMNQEGYSIDTLICCGGGTKNKIFLEQHANITSCRLILPKEKESVLLGSAMLGAVASGIFENLKDAMSSMSSKDKIINPNLITKEYHQEKYEVFQKLYDHQTEYDNIMNI